MYGIIYNIEDTPNDNFWTQGREIELNDGRIVFGYEGQTDVSDIGIAFQNAEEISNWLDENRKQQDQEI